MYRAARQNRRLIISKKNQKFFFQIFFHLHLKSPSTIENILHSCEWKQGISITQFVSRTFPASPDDSLTTCRMHLQTYLKASQLAQYPIYHHEAYLAST